MALFSSSFFIKIKPIVCWSSTSYLFSSSNACTPKRKACNPFFRSLFSLSHLTSYGCCYSNWLARIVTIIFVNVCNEFYRALIASGSKTTTKTIKKKKRKIFSSVSRSSWNCTDKSLCHLIACNTMQVFILPACNDTLWLLFFFYIFFIASVFVELSVCILPEWIEVDCICRQSAETDCLPISVLFARIYSAFCSLYVYADWNEIVRCYCVGILMVSLVRI